LICFNALLFAQQETGTTAPITTGNTLFYAELGGPGLEGFTMKN